MCFLSSFAFPDRTLSCAQRKTVSICLTFLNPCLDPIESPVVASMWPTIETLIPQSWRVDCSPSAWQSPETKLNHNIPLLLNSKQYLLVICMLCDSYTCLAATLYQLLTCGNECNLHDLHLPTLQDSRFVNYFHIQTTRRWGRNTFLITDKHVALFLVCFDAVVVRRRVGQVLISP